MTCWVFHKWSKWSAPEAAETKWGNTALVQRRVCKGCEAVEYRRVTVMYGS